MSADDAVTALAMRLEELAREVDEASQAAARDRQDVAAAKTAVAQWNARLTVEGIGPTLAMRRDIKNLSERIDALAKTLGTALDQGKLKAPRGPRWDNLSRDQEAAQLARLRDWVNGILRCQYPGYKLPDCWAAHREALWELGALHAEWQRVFDDPLGADLESMLWFHERWLPGTLSRLNKVITCRAGFECQATREGQRAQRTAYR
jgi:hypothetical protein